MSIADAIDGFFQSLFVRASANPQTLERYARAWRRFADWLAERDITTIEQLKAEHARHFILSRLAVVSLVPAHYPAAAGRRSSATTTSARD